jgi:tetratricopeptide (TPR) repeat protein
MMTLRERFQIGAMRIGGKKVPEDRAEAFSLLLAHTRAEAERAVQSMVSGLSKARAASDEQQRQLAMEAELRGQAQRADKLHQDRLAAGSCRSADAWSAYGHFQCRRGKLAEASACFREALDVEPGAPRVLIALAAIELEKEEHDNVVALLGSIVGDGGGRSKQTSPTPTASNSGSDRVGEDPTGWLARAIMSHSLEMLEEFDRRDRLLAAAAKAARMSGPAVQCAAARQLLLFRLPQSARALLKLAEEDLDELKERGEEARFVAPVLALFALPRHLCSGFRS